MQAEHSLLNDVENKRASSAVRWNKTKNIRHNLDEDTDSKKD